MWPGKLASSMQPGKLGILNGALVELVEAIIDEDHKLTYKTYMTNLV